jgi:hypothetical protein
VFFFLLTYLVFQIFDVTMWNPEADGGNGATESLDLSTIDIMLFCSVLVSSDIIAAMSILKFDE